MGIFTLVPHVSAAFFEAFFRAPGLVETISIDLLTKFL